MIVRATTAFPSSSFPTIPCLCRRLRPSALSSHNDFYGGVVPYPFVKTIAITHELVHQDAERPAGWSAAFAEKVREIVLPGHSVFSVRDAHMAAKRMLRHGTVRAKKFAWRVWKRSDADK